MLIFLKLGGSLITDKEAVESPRREIITRVANEIADSRRRLPDVKLVIGHGSGSYGHTAAAKYGTHNGVRSASDWAGFAEVGVTAARLNHLMVEALYDADIPVFRLQLSASAVCTDRNITTMAVEPIKQALDVRLVPVVYGDVAFDREIGGTIISTETIFSYLAEELHPDQILLAGNYSGVLDTNGRVIKRITPNSFEGLIDVLGGSEATDVTGGMASKVKGMLSLCERLDGLQVRIFSGKKEGMVQRALTGTLTEGTLITGYGE